MGVGKMTTGGLSAGGFMAVQFHVAFSSSVSGASVFAGGPYYCSGGSEDTALLNCMNPNMVMKPPSPSSLASYTHLAYDLKLIDNPDNLNTTRVFIYSGELDTVVHRPVVVDLQEYYELMAPQGSVVTEFDIMSEHMYPTLNWGEACTTKGEPFIGKCNYDGAGAALAQLYGTLKPKVTQVAANLMQFSQTQFVSDPASISLNSIGYIYVPTSCQQGATCSLHVEFHGCEQTTADIGEEYPQHVGLNEWAESNDIIVVYPQVVRSYLSPANPEGCWDWWGYTNKNFAYQSGPQMAFAFKLAQTIMGQTSA